MSPTERPQRGLRDIRALAAGPVALRHLRQAATDGEVLASFRQSAYVRLGDDDVVCLCSAQLRPGPLNVTCQVPETLFAGMRPGTPARTRSGSLQVDELCFDLETVVEWRPAQVVARRHWCEIEYCLAMLARALERYELAEGFAPLLRQLCTDWRALEATGSGELNLLELAIPRISGLLAWLGCGTNDIPPATVAGLMGLGPGLTPSGDDLLCGILVTLHSTGHTQMASRLAEVVMREAASGTSIISRAHLSCACQGLGSEALHEALCALLAGDAPSLDRALAALNRTGHSSGWDGLAGVVACLAVTRAR